MEDLIVDDEVLEQIITTYSGLREMFRNGETFDPMRENKEFVRVCLEYTENSSEEYNNLVEGVDLFLGYVHAIFQVDRDGGDGTTRSQCIENANNFLTTPDTRDDEWLGHSKSLIVEWVKGLESPEAPY